MLCWISVLSGCAEIDKGQYNSGEAYKGAGLRMGYTIATPDKAQVTEACWVEANNRVGRDFMADDRSRRVYFSQCMLKVALFEIGTVS